VQLVHAANSHVGMIRAGNEDSFYADADPTRGLFIVADGMGGHAAGEVASEMAVQIVTRELATIRDLGDGVVPHVASALKSANQAIFRRTLAEVDKQGMGTTVSVLLLAGERYLIGQVGDSRVYLLRDGTLRQLTKDHSYVQEQVDAGYLTPEQARYHPYSDGLTGMVDDRRLQQLLLSRAAPGRIVDALISEANGRGGLDNITAIVVQVEGLDGGRLDGPTLETPAFDARG
jgi:serine/threonine protein phosphatase PrpC